MRFSHGILLTPVLLGYDHDEEGNLIINEEEALTVRLIFFMYIYGFTLSQIAEKLTELKRLTKKGNTTWTASSVTNILRNERYCGDVLTSKTFTPSYKTHQARKNRGERTQYRWKDHHEAIITRDDFIAVQHMLSNCKNGMGALPELKVIEKGPFKGFVRVNIHWAMFKPEDYYSASAGVYKKGESVERTEEYTVEAEDGEFDLRGFEIARSQFFESNDKMLINFANNYLSFSTACVRRLSHSSYIEMYVHPVKKLLFIMECASTEKNALKWIKYRADGTARPRSIRATGFCGTLFEMFGWNSDFKYRFQGVKKEQGKKSIILFDLSESEIFIPNTSIESDNSEETIEPVIPRRGNSILAMPEDWSGTFGNEFYVHGGKQDKGIDEDKWGSNQQTASYSAIPDLKVPSETAVASEIRGIITTMQEVKTDG